MRDLAARIAGAGRFAFDVEFVSEARFIPELSLVQVAWGHDEAPEIALVDCVAADPAPLLELIASDAIESVAHSARQDLGLLAARFGITARGFWDTQIAAAFAGIAEQIGYGKLVQELAGVTLDKGAQFTAWLERPLSPKQLRYAADDVRYLPRVWSLLRDRLTGLGRLDWVGEESARLAAGAMPYGPPGEAYRAIKGRGALKGRALARLRALAAWRQEQALDENKPLSWVLPDRAMVELSRRGARAPRDLLSAQGVGGGIVRRYGDAILGCLARAEHDQPPPAEPAGTPLEPRAQARAAVVHALIQALCADAGIAARFVGTRADAEALVTWHQANPGADAAEIDLPLLSGWRRELAGAPALAWLRGGAAVACSAESDGGLALVDVREPA